MTEDREIERTLGSMLAATSVLYEAANASKVDLSAPPPPPRNLATIEQHRDGRASATSGAPVMIQSKVVADEQWQKAYKMLDTNPQLMTSSVLGMALRRRAPIYLVRFMLKLNPNSASIPNQGPSPLQIALQSSCSVDVVKALVEVCPFALVVTNPGSYLDPLSYAKRFRSSETELIRLLSVPLSHWINLKEEGIGSVRIKEAASSSSDSMKPDSRSKLNRPILVPPVPTRNRFDARDLTSLDSTELNNIKLICLTVLKGHKRLQREILDVQKQVNGIEAGTRAAIQSMTRKQLQSSDITGIVELHNESLISKIQEQQQKLARTHLIALEMKEQAMSSSVRRMERRVLRSVQNYRDETMAKIEIRLNAVVGGLQVRLQNFTDRINLMESLERGAITKDFGNPDSQATRVFANSSRHETKHNLLVSVGKSPRRAGAASPSSYTYRSDRTLETLDESDHNSMPIVYASPYKKTRGGDDMRSLLTGTTFVDRPSHYHYQRPRRVLAAGKRVLVLLCKH